MKHFSSRGFLGFFWWGAGLIQFNLVPIVLFPSIFLHLNSGSSTSALLCVHCILPVLSSLFKPLASRGSRRLSSLRGYTSTWSAYSSVVLSPWCFSYRAASVRPGNQAARERNLGSRSKRILGIMSELVRLFLFSHSTFRSLVAVRVVYPFARPRRACGIRAIGSMLADCGC